MHVWEGSRIIASCTFTVCVEVEDLERHRPGVVDRLREWLRNYKVSLTCADRTQSPHEFTLTPRRAQTFEGKKENTFGLGERAMPAAFAQAVVEETVADYKRCYG